MALVVDDPVWTGDDELFMVVPLRWRQRFRALFRGEVCVVGVAPVPTPALTVTVTPAANVPVGTVQTALPVHHDRPPWTPARIPAPEDRPCCDSSAGQPHRLACRLVQDYEARACCDTAPGYPHNPWCCATDAIRAAMAAHERVALRAKTQGGRHTGGVAGAADD